MFTFDSLPLSICPQKYQHFISTSSERRRLCENFGIDVEIEYPFTDEFMHMEPEDFICRILIDKLHAKYVVVGTDYRFGKDRAGDAAMLVEAGKELGFTTIIVEKEKYELAGIIGKGSDRTKKIANDFNVPVYTNIENIEANIDAACVVVPNAAGGGQGTDIAEKLLLRGIPTLLEHPAHEKEIIKCLKASKNTPFMINPFYRYISPVQDFLEAAKVMNHHSVLLSASLDCAIHVLYDGIDILGCALENFSGWKLGTVAEIVGSTLKSGGNKSIKIMIGDIPVMFVINTDVDKDDPDHPLHLYHRIELTFSTGRLCLVNTHGPVIWMPFQHMPRDEYGTISIDKDNKEIPTAIMLGNSKPLSLKKTVEYIWTGAVVQALECLFSMDKTKKMQMAQYQIFVSRLWSEISRKTGYLNLVNYNNSGNNEEIFDELQKKGLLEEKIFV